MLWTVRERVKVNRTDKCFGFMSLRYGTQSRSKTDNFTQPWINSTEIMWPLVRQLLFPEKQQWSNPEITGVISLAFWTKHTFLKWDIYPNKPRNNKQTDYLWQKSKFSLVKLKQNLHQLKALAIFTLVKQLCSAWISLFLLFKAFILKSELISFVYL